MSILYRLHNLRKHHGERTALDLHELEIAKGRVHILQGANGSGKTTLLNILAFLSVPSSGELIFAGRKVDYRQGEVFKLRREVTLLHQAPYLFDSRVYDNISFGLAARGVKGEQQRKLVAEALTMVGLNGFEKRLARELSGGEIQRVAMARALAMKPAVILLDEPLSNVDRDTAELLEHLIAALPKGGTTVVMATHDHELPVRLSVEVITLRNGENVSSGECSEDKQYANF